MEGTITAQKFVNFLIERKCIKFAPNKDEFFTLRSNRRSPVYINMGSLIDGEALNILADAYADKINDLIKNNAIEPFDVIFGPAYKGISLGALTTASLYRRHKIDCRFLYNRKEAKLHGDVSADKIIVGADQFDQSSKILIIDDVISSGKSKFDAAQKLALLGNHEVVGVLVAVDRQEMGGDNDHNTISVADEINQKMHCPLFSIANMGDIFLSIRPKLSQYQIETLQNYFKKFGSPPARKWAE